PGGISTWAVPAFAVPLALAAACGSELPGSQFDDGRGSQDGGGDDGSIGLGGDGSGGLGDAGNVLSIEFDPPQATITSDGVAAQTANFTLRAHFVDGTTAAVAPESAQFDRPDLASLASGNPVALTTSGTYAGTGKLHGVYRGAAASATLTVNVRMSTGTSVIPQNVKAALDAATSP